MLATSDSKRGIISAVGMALSNKLYLTLCTMCKNQDHVHNTNKAWNNSANSLYLEWKEKTPKIPNAWVHLKCHDVIIVAPTIWTRDLVLQFHKYCQKEYRKPPFIDENFTRLYQRKPYQQIGKYVACEIPMPNVFSSRVYICLSFAWTNQLGRYESINQTFKY